MNWMPRQAIDLEASLPARREAMAWETVLVIWRQRRLILALVALALIGAGIYLWRLDSTYSAEALVQVDFGRDQAAASPQTGGVQVDPNALVEGEARLIRSQPVARRVIDRLDLEADPTFAPRAGLLSRLTPRWLSRSPATSTSPGDMIALGLLKQLSVKNDSRSYLIAVTYVSPDPSRSATIANAFAEEYIKTRVEASVETAQRTSEWLAVQVRDARKALADAEESIASYRTASGFVEASAEGSGVSQNQLRDATAQLESATLARVVAEGRLRRVQEAVRLGYPPEPIDATDASTLQRLVEAEATAARAVAETRQAYGVRHPNSERAALAQRDARERLLEEVKRVLAAHQAALATAWSTEASLQDRVELLQRVAIESKSREARLRALQAEASALRERTRILTESYERARALSDLRPAVARIVLPARAITVPSGPNRPLILGLATAGAIGAGMGAALLLNRRDRGFDKGRDVTSSTDYRCLGTIPEVRPADSPLQWALFSEAIRNLTANLGLLDAGTTRSLLITSASPREGKTILTVALAKCLAELGHQVLVIDTSPGAARNQPPNATTLEQLLDSSRPWSDGDDAGDRIRLVRRATGIGDEGNLFGPAFDRLIQAARQRYDTVLIEAAPIELLADAVILARNVDVVILATRWMSTPRARVAAAIGRLGASSARLAGIVLCRADPDAALGRRCRQMRESYFASHVDPTQKLSLENASCAS